MAKQETKVERAPALSLSELHKQFVIAKESGEDYAALAKRLGRKESSIIQRVGVLRKRLREEYNTELGTLAGSRGRKKEDLSAIAEQIKAEQKAAAESME